MVAANRVGGEDAFDVLAADDCASWAGVCRLIAANESRRGLGTLFRRNRTPLVPAGLGAVATVAGAIVLRSSVPVVIATAVVLAAALLFFAVLLPAYTPQGRTLEDGIDGLRRYLGVAEGDHLARLQSPRLTPKEFGGKLPRLPSLAPWQGRTPYP